MERVRCQDRKGDREELRGVKVELKGREEKESEDKKEE
jgi:hypothetical protein